MLSAIGDCAPSSDLDNPSSQPLVLSQYSHHQPQQPQQQQHLHQQQPQQQQQLQPHPDDIRSLNVSPNVLLASPINLPSSNTLPYSTLSDNANNYLSLTQSLEASVNNPNIQQWLVPSQCFLLNQFKVVTAKLLWYIDIKLSWYKLHIFQLSSFQAQWMYVTFLSYLAQLARVNKFHSVAQARHILICQVMMVGTGNNELILCYEISK